MKRFSLHLIAAALPLLAATQANAHGLWTEQRRGHIEVVVGEGAEDDAFDPAQVKAAHAWNGKGDALKVEIEKLKDHARLAPAKGAAVVAVEFDAGVWTKDADGKWAEKPKAEVKNAVSTTQGLRYSLAINDHYSQLPKLDKLGLVIVPQVDPATVGQGKPLAVQVLSNGKPVEGVKLYEDFRNMPEQATITTDKDGRAQVTVRNEGLNVIAAYSEAKVEGNKALDAYGYFTSLTFVGAEHHE
ncbi:MULTISPECIES: DUF4198 domain-containing protein [unclassified Pseudomonas]|uniref:DUF4198 domain-containing protein n=1 Tax=unclassified Pseudomonas TaxID=196821 RepID=UPI000BC52D72|nr:MULTISPECIES: DUF4198 domain-containing protein [unclassified Pseudomonas]PVZ11387.1 putative GH25 family protein [Pseudomonas sp. URIL14HWK12:I12]PVZ22385.1 putative GH25 family protein [Pseudomonas sp. URIL14HWK12:I10]PVZ31491.1 putative GH25 family protein [Pseudomonas sp. URIL14HWK12:I11]SNZ16444.1 Uncharacterized conserved protein, contains GH25 family domain [Pseudomonas sp. URIL14HWK12:I9]